MSVTKSNQIAHMFDVFLPGKHFKKAVFGYNIIVLKKIILALKEYQTLSDYITYFDVSCMIT